jgi:hypothetical protein
MTSRGKCKYKATAKTRAKTEADPYGMTNKKATATAWSLVALAVR